MKDDIAVDPGAEVPSAATPGGRIASAARACLAVLMLVGVGLMFANVVARYLFAAPFYWAEEAAVYLNVWSVFIGVALVTLGNAHLRMDLVVRSMPAAWRRLLSLLGWMTCVVVCIVVLYGSGLLLQQLWQADLRSVAIGLPMTVVHGAVFVGFLGTLIVLLMEWRRFGDVPQEDLGVQEEKA